MSVQYTKNGWRMTTRWQAFAMGCMFGPLFLALVVVVLS